MLETDNLSALLPSHTHNLTFKEGRGDPTTEVLPKQIGRLDIITKGAIINQELDSNLHSLVLNLNCVAGVARKKSWGGENYFGQHFYVPYFPHRRTSMFRCLGFSSTVIFQIRTNLNVHKIKVL